MEKVGIVGSGIAGLACAWELRDAAEVTLLEKNDYPGGHTNTRSVLEDGREIPIDTGFIVFNKPTYPLLTALFEELEIPIKPAEMSFAVRHDTDDVEFNGMGFFKLFTQKRNLVRPKFLRMLRDILRFFRVVRKALADSSLDSMTLAEFVEKHRFGREFREWYLLPMGAAVWSTPPDAMLAFPARSLLQFFSNHGFLGLTTHHQWLTVDGGAKQYVERILPRSGALRLQAPVRAIEETPGGIKARTMSGEVLRFDRVVLACHADEALGLLPRPDSLQSELLSPFQYQKNHATLHTDPRFLPRRRSAWASWNFHVDPSSDQTAGPTVHYWMNALQSPPVKKDYFVSLNCKGKIPPEAVLYETEYTHPVFTMEAMRAQARLQELNRRSPGQRLFFCGSYFRHGFHEDALASAMELTKTLRPNLRKASAEGG